MTASAHVSLRVRLHDLTQAAVGPLLVAVTYYLGAEAAFAVGTLSDRIFAPFWPPNIVLLCGLLLLPPRRWWIVLAAALPAHIIAEIGVGMPPHQYMIAFVTNCMVALLSAVGITRLIGPPPWFITLRQGFLYVLVAVGASPALSALGGATVRIAGGGGLEQYWTFWAQWFAGNALTAVTLGPPCLIWIGGAASASVLDGPRKAEAALLLIGLVGTCAVAFGVDPAALADGFLPTLFYLPIPFIVWATVRFGALGASSAILVVAIVSIAGNLRGATIFTAGDAEHTVLALQVFLTALSIPTLLLGAAIEELQRARGAMQELAGAVLRSHDDERRRVAQALHDTIGQDLAAADLVLARLEQTTPGAPRPIITELAAIHRHAADEIRAVSYLLHPPLLEDSGLALALRNYVAGFAARGVTVDLALAPDLQRLPGDVEFVLFRVIQDAVTALQCRSDAERAHIALTLDRRNGAQTVTLTIEDVGDAANTPSHEAAGIRLASMRERLRRVGGSLTVDALPGRTLVTAVVPIAG